MNFPFLLSLSISFFLTLKYFEASIGKTAVTKIGIWLATLYVGTASLTVAWLVLIVRNLRVGR